MCILSTTFLKFFDILYLKILLYHNNGYNINKCKREVSNDKKIISYIT